MKKAFVEFISIFVAGCLFFSCNPSTGDDSGEEIQQQQKEQQQQENSEKTEKDDKDSVETVDGENKPDDKEDTTPVLNRKIGVTFNISGAQALAKLESENTRAAASSRLGDIVKIMSDGSMEDAVFVEENCELSDIVSIYKSPLEDSGEVFLVMSGESKIGYEEVNKEYDWGGTYKENQDIRVGQLLALHEDGTIADILKKENATGFEDAHMSLKTESVTFDKAGNLYFISSGNGDMIYQYNPKTAKLTQMVAAVDSTFYEKMQIDDEGQWIFVSGCRNSAWFLRAIPINNPNNFVNVYYSSTIARFEPNAWVYDSKTEKIFFIATDGANSGLFMATKEGGFKDKTFYHSVVGDNFYIDDLFEYYSIYDGINWQETIKKSNGTINTQKVINIILSWLPTYYDYNSNETKTITTTDVDICFKKYATAKGFLKDLAILTNGKKNEEALEALDSKEGRSALYSLFFYNMEGVEDPVVSGVHSFLSDVLYVKGTDTLLSQSTDVLFDYKASSDSEIVSVTGTSVFENYIDEYNRHDEPVNFDDLIECKSVSYRNCIRFSSKYYDTDGRLNSRSLLNLFYDYCNVEGEKSFSLRAFKDDSLYGNLYTTKTDEEAIEWIASDLDRMESLNNVVGIYIYSNNMASHIYSDFMNFIAKTCFIKGTNQKASTWNWDMNEQDGPGSYIYYSSGSGAKFNTTDSGVYYEYYNTSGSNPYYYIVQISDSKGRNLEVVNKLPFPYGMVVNSEKHKNRILLQYSMMDQNGAELGYHQIYCIDMKEGRIINCFENVPNRNNLEVVAFSSAGDLLYYSAVRGTLVENGIVNLLTNEYNPLSVQRKMVAVYTFN